jgi:hypothetical protein
MWWGLLLLIGMAVLGPTIESIETRWVNRKASEELAQMRMQIKSGAQWDATHGTWKA